MNKKARNNLFIILLLLLLFIPMLTIKADSGWDVSYGDYGGSSDYGSYGGSSSYGGSRSRGGSDSFGSYDYSGYDSGYYMSSNNMTRMIYFIFQLTFLFMVLVFVLAKSFKGGHRITIYEHNDYMTQEEVNRIDNSIIVEKILDYTYDLYVNVQNAWMNFDYDNLRKYLSDELYNTYEMQLKTLELEHGKNIMSDFELIDGGIVTITKNELTEEVIMELVVKLRDYVINTTNDIVINGNKFSKVIVKYQITLERSIRDQLTNCPNCGGKLSDEASVKCSHCDAVLVKGSKDFVMTKKVNKKQYRRYNEHK